jgi:RNA polymerase sigma-70 factor (ECF subfamily)
MAEEASLVGAGAATSADGHPDSTASPPQAFFDGTWDMNGFRPFFERWSTKIHAFAIRLGVPYGDADDIVQETMLAVWRRCDRGGIDPNKPWGAYVYTVARHLIWNRRRQKVGLPEIPMPEAAANDLAFATMPDVWRVFELDELDALLDKLGMKTGQDGWCLVMSHISGLTYEEMASACGVDANTLKTRKCRALARARQLAAQMHLEGGR